MDALRLPSTLILVFEHPRKVEHGANTALRTTRARHTEMAIEAALTRSWKSPREAARKAPPLTYVRQPETLIEGSMERTQTSESGAATSKRRMRTILLPRSRRGPCRFRPLRLLYREPRP